ncbi:peptide/nickel transport system permease protein [Rhodococcus sp. 27YEA15]|uniref:ABC transporter permease n=1 Tax=Rhodococcus sp. 27YEA15 TaxID=3156259 RepID=UPI003C7B35CF
MTVLEPHRAGATPVSTRRVRVRRLLRRPTFTISVAVLIFWILAPIVVRAVGLDPYGEAGAANQPPGGGHLLGTDDLGRSVAVRVLAGAGPVLQVAPAATLLAALVGTVLGLIAGYHRGGIVDDLLMRSFDIFNALPGIVAVLLVASAFGRSPSTLIISIAIFFAPIIARTVRSAVLVEMGKQYVEAARTQGESTTRILFGELLPNVTPALVVEGTIRLGYAIFVSAGLSFLNLGAQPPSPDWGLVVSQNRIYIQNAWWSVAFPALAIISLAVAVNLIADNLKEVLDR